MSEHAGRVALVTGGSSGIGRGVALELAEQGASVVVHGLVHDQAESVADEIRRFGRRAVATAGPIGLAQTSERAVQLALDEFGGLDTLVTSAGIQWYGDVVETSAEGWAEVFDTNVTGVFLAAHYALPFIRMSAAGSVVIVSSVQATASQAGVPAYAASKGALLALARAMAVDEGPHGVRVNSVSPGSVDTPMLRAAAARFTEDPDAIEKLVRNWGTAHPLGRVATPAEVGAVVSFLASPRASFVSGDDVRVDGGLLSRLAAALPEPDAGSR